MKLGNRKTNSIFSGGRPPNAYSTPRSIQKTLGSENCRGFLCLKVPSPADTDPWEPEMVDGGVVTNQIRLVVRPFCARSLMYPHRVLAEGGKVGAPNPHHFAAWHVRATEDPGNALNGHPGTNKGTKYLSGGEGMVGPESTLCSDLESLCF